MKSIRLQDPFTPMALASGEGEFFGRAHEIATLQDKLNRGHIAIHGPVGIGKSSLLARISKIMQGDKEARHRSVLLHSVCHSQITTPDQAASLILSNLPIKSQTKTKWTFGVPNVVGFESESSFVSTVGESPLSVLQRFVENTANGQMEYLILTFDQAEMCPSALTPLVRTLLTAVELKGCHKLRLILTGVSPYFDRVIHTDTGLGRLFSLVHVLPLLADEALDLVETKFRIIVETSERDGLNVRIDPDVPVGIVRLSGGHPHLIQLLGSHLVQHENANPDDLIDVHDLGGAVRTICYDDRGQIYTKIIESLEAADLLRPLESILGLATSRHPTQIKRKVAQQYVGPEIVEEFIKRDIFVRTGKHDLRLVDEFLGLRLSLDQAAEPGTGNSLDYDEREIERIFRSGSEDEDDEWDDSDGL